MAKKLTAKLTLDTVQANRNAKRLKSELRGVDREMRNTQGSADSAGSSMEGWSLKGVAAAAAIIAAVTAVIDKLNEAIQAQDRLAAKSFGLQAQVAGAATQFGLTPEQTVSLLGPIAQHAGFGDQGFGDLSALATAASSAQLIQDPRIGPGGVPQFPGQGAEVLTTLGGFVQRIGEPGVGGAVSKLVRGGLGGQAATQGNVQEVLGDILGAFRGSQAADLGAFLQGAQAGTAGLTAQGVSQRTGLALYGGLIKQTATERQAAEILRITGEKFFTGDDPAIVSAIDEKLGQGEFFRLKREDPDRLFRESLGILLGQEGQARSELFADLGITPEVGARLANLQATQEAAAGVRERIETTTGGDIQQEIAKFTGSGLGLQRATEAGIATRQAGFGTGGRAEAAAARKLAEAERERLKADSPLELGLLEFFEIGTEAEQESLLRGVLIREIEKRFPEREFREIIEGTGKPDITAEGVKFPGRGRSQDVFRDVFRELTTGTSGGVVERNNIKIENNYGSNSRATHELKKTDKVRRPEAP